MSNGQILTTAMADCPGDRDISAEPLAIMAANTAIAFVVTRSVSPHRGQCFHARRPGARQRRVRANHIAMYLHHVVCGATLTAAGKALGRDRTTAAYACRRIEDLRDDNQFDFTLDVLSCALAALLRRV